MRLRIEIVQSSDWLKSSEDAHRAVFGVGRSANRDRFDYVYLVIGDDKPFGYVMVREIDANEVYWQFGGVFQWARNSIWITKAFDEIVRRQSQKGAKVIGFRIEGNNFPMLKLAISRKFQIIGTRTRDQRVLVEMMRECNGDE